MAVVLPSLGVAAPLPSALLPLLDGDRRWTRSGDDGGAVEQADAKTTVESGEIRPQGSRIQQIQPRGSRIWPQGARIHPRI
ncbi:unnamed protein product [Miscanthus lutarioriparius]|uniref:Uncharacterized protein n=1 Tax=Miscanthus lutarioriparius TaxID=422564 RepID=A0A811RB62_9POAL|nr:unnamed protein product [Miscanthus lutarioriparius]